jgi:amino acid adenylation domain-containing protein/non-ribosomal peptide synthase protein (TIGR01720 family)
MSKKDIEDVYGLSPLQQGMLFQTLSNQNSKLYFQQLNCTLRGKVDIPTLKRAWDRVAERHVVLRTSFAWVGVKKPVQIVHRHRPLDWVELDWRNLDVTEQKIALVEYAQADQERGYDMSKAPLMRLALIRLADETYHFIWSYHHVLLDGWSFSTIFGEALNFYQAFINGQELNLPEPTPFRAYIEWLLRQNLDEAETFWRSTLKNFLAPTPLPFDFLHSNGATDVPRYYSQHLSVASTTSASLQHLARQYQLTLNTIVQGAWALLLSHYSGNRDVLFGATVSGRPAELPGVEAMVGMFINTLPVRVQLEEKQNVVQWLQQLQWDQLEARQYEYSPLAQVQGWSEMGRGHGLFDSLVAFENFPMNVSSLQRQQQRLGISAETNEQSSNYEKSTYSLTLIVVPGEEIFLQLTYNQRRFSDETITRLLKHFQRLLEVFAAEPEITLGEVPLLSEAEKRQLLCDWNRTDTAEYQAECVHRLFELQVEQTPEQIAVEFGGERVSYRELNERANRLGRYLQEQGVGPEVVVGLCLERSVEMVVGVLGVLKAGGAYLPLDPGYPLERLSFMLEETAVPVLLTQERLRNQLPREAPVLTLDREWPEREKEYEGENIASEVMGENLAYVIYTSGSTGKPKGVMIPHYGLVNYLSWCTKAYAVAEGQGSAVHSSIAFDLTITSLFAPLLVGRSVVLLPEEQGIEGLVAALSTANDFSLIKLTPAHLELLSQLLPAEKVNGKTRAFIIGGEELRSENLEFWRTHSPATRLINEYGPTESVVGCCVYEVADDDPSSGPVPIGKPIANTEFYIVNEQMQPVPVGVSGELLIGGAGLARGYWRRPELTAEKFVPHPFSERAGARLYRTGDLARYLADGRVEFLGRRDQQVKLRGYRIELGEIEAVLRSQPGVQDAVVVVQARAGGEKRLVGYVVRAAKAKSMREWRRRQRAERKRLSEQLPEYMIPAVIVELRELPLTINGKVDRRALPEPDGARPEWVTRYEAPRNEVEAKLCRIWAEVLGLERVGIHDNFFELGGDSILSIQIVARANQKGLRLAHKHLLEHRTVIELAAVVDTTPVIENEQGEVSGQQRLTPIQQWFFAQQSEELHHWNQTTLVSVSGRVQPELLKAAVGALLRHHDALRLRFRRAGEGAGEGWKAHYAAVSSEVPFTMHDLSDVPVAEQRAEIERLAAAAESSLDLSEGPLLQVHYYKLGVDKSGTERGRLLMVIHHLVVDIVSWAILLEDLQHGYEQLEQGATEVQLPAKTTSYQQWAEVLQEYAQSLRLLVEMDFWLDDKRREVAPLPTDFSDGENLESTTRQLSMYLNVEETQKLVFEVSKAANVQVNEVLLTVLAETLSQWTGDKHVLIDVEGHGREETIGEVDLTRTVGWFTALHPVLLTLAEDAPWEERLRMVTKQLRAVPKRGIGYGVLRYLSGKKELVDRLESLPQPEIAFNYSRFVQGQEQEPERLRQRSLRFGSAPESPGPLYSARARRTHLLEVNASIAGQQLCVRWNFSDRRHARATVERLAQEFLNELRGLIGSFQKTEVQPQPLSPGIKGSFAIPQLTDESPFWAPLVPLQQRGSKAPIFCVHPAGGSVLPLVDLARQFSPDQPFYGLQAVGLYEEREPYITIEEMAARYVDEIRLIQPEGPYAIGGLSFGGNVAFEIAQQLHNQNQAVSLLAILDTIAPSFDIEQHERTHDPDAFLFSRAIEASEASGKKLSLTLAEFRQLDLEAQLEFVLDHLKATRAFASDTKLRQARLKLKVFQNHGRAIRNYRPRVYPDRITLFRSSDKGDSKFFQNMYDNPSFADPAMGWGPLSSEPIEIYYVPGDHGQIVIEPYVRIMAQQMRACLEKRKEVFANEAQPSHSHWASAR